MSYRPICDLWLLTRCKYKGGVKRYGGYLGGFPERARRLIGCAINEPMLHVCGGLARLYPYAGGFGPHDQTLDNDPSTSPDFLLDAEDFIPSSPKDTTDYWGGILIDPPYSEKDAKNYPLGTYPNPNKLLANSLAVLPVGRKVGIILYGLPRCQLTVEKDGEVLEIAKFIACVGVVCGFGNRGRWFSVFEKLK